MTNRSGLRFVTVAGGVLFLVGATAPVAAQIRIDKDETGRIVAMSNLATTSGCARASGRGRVVKQHFESGQMKGVTFKDAQYGDSYLNLPYLGTISPASARARVAEGFAALLVPGQELKVETLGCGAAGRIEKLAAVSLVGPRPTPARAAAAAGAPAPVAAAPAPAPAAPPVAPAPADPMDALLRSPDSSPKAATVPKVDEPPPAVGQPKPAVEPSAAASQPAAATEPPPAAPRRPSRWRLTQPTKVQVDLEIQSNDRAFGFSLSCTRGPKGNLQISNWFLPPRNWAISKSPTPASIDGRRQRWEIDGADEGLVFSDPAGSSSGLSTLSAAARGELARGQRLVVNGRMDRGGRARDAVFDISGGDEAFASLEARCRALRS